MDHASTPATETERSPALAPGAPTLAGQKIRAFRTARGWTQQQLAEALAAHMGLAEPVPQSTITGWELRGKDARAVFRKALAELGACQGDDWLAAALNRPEQDEAPQERAA